MLAARMYNKKDIRVEEAPIPAIEEDGILLKVKAAALPNTWPFPPRRCHRGT